MAVIGNVKFIKTEIELTHLENVNTILDSPSTVYIIYIIYTHIYIYIYNNIIYYIYISI